LDQQTDVAAISQKYSCKEQRRPRQRIQTAAVATRASEPHDQDCAKTVKDNELLRIKQLPQITYIDMKRLSSEDGKPKNEKWKIKKNSSSGTIPNINQQNDIKDPLLAFTGLLDSRNHFREPPFNNSKSILATTTERSPRSTGPVSTMTVTQTLIHQTITLRQPCAGISSYDLSFPLKSLHPPS
jgi:hypothetical protein